MPTVKLFVPAAIEIPRNRLGGALNRLNRRALAALSGEASYWSKHHVRVHVRQSLLERLAGQASGWRGGRSKTLRPGNDLDGRFDDFAILLSLPRQILFVELVAVCRLRLAASLEALVHRALEEVEFLLAGEGDDLGGGDFGGHLRFPFVRAGSKWPALFISSTIKYNDFLYQSQVFLLCISEISCMFSRFVLSLKHELVIQHEEEGFMAGQKGFQVPYLRAWREKRALQQDELGALAGLTATTISRIEHGATARLGTIGKLSTALGITREQLLRTMPGKERPAA